MHCSKIASGLACSLWGMPLGVMSLGSRLRARLAVPTRPTIRHDAGYLKEQVGRVPSRLTCRIKHRCDLADVSPDQVFAFEAADHHLRIADSIAANFRHTRPHGIGCIQAIDVESDVGRTITNHAINLAHDRLAPDRFIFVDGDHPHARPLAPDRIVFADAAAPEADLQRAPRIDETFLDATSERRCMVDLRSQDFVERIWVGIELDDANRSVLSNNPQDRQWHGMIAPDGDRDRTSVMNAPDRRLNEPDAAGRIERVYGRITDVRYVAQSEWSNPAGGMDLSDDPRGFTHRSRSVARTRSKVHAHIERYADERDVDLCADFHAARAHKGCNVCKSRRQQGIEGLKARIVLHRLPLSWACRNFGRNDRVPSRRYITGFSGSPPAPHPILRYACLSRSPVAGPLLRTPPCPPPHARLRVARFAP